MPPTTILSTVSISDLDHTQLQLLNRLKKELTDRHSLAVDDNWLASFISTLGQPISPIPALARTAVFRLLGTDFTKTLTHPEEAASNPTKDNVFPNDVADVQTKSRTLNTSVPVQVLDIKDIGSSGWAQIETIERIERGEETRGREVIRTVPSMNGNENDDGTAGQTTQARAAKKSTGPHMLLLQDRTGRTVYGFEQVKMHKLCIVQDGDPAEGGLSIGAKLLLRVGTPVRRRMIMLDPEYVEILGGKIQLWDDKWRETRKQRLLAEIEQDQEQARVSKGL